MITTDLLIWLAIVGAATTLACFLSQAEKDVRVRVRRSPVRDLTPVYHLGRTSIRRRRR